MTRPNWFIGLPVATNPALEDLRTSLPAGLRRFHPDDLHITLAFFGAVGESTARQAWRAANGIAVGAFHVRARRLVALGRPSRPSAYGVELDDDWSSLAGFIDQQRNPLRVAAGLVVEDRPALPHMTIARPPRRCGPAIRERADRWMTGTRLPAMTFTLDRLALYTWSRDRRIRQFARVAERGLA